LQIDITLGGFIVAFTIIIFSVLTGDVPQLFDALTDIVPKPLPVQVEIIDDVPIPFIMLPPAKFQLYIIPCIGFRILTELLEPTQTLSIEFIIGALGIVFIVTLAVLVPAVVQPAALTE
jgi:hypothetical protein